MPIPPFPSPRNWRPPPRPDHARDIPPSHDIGQETARNPAQNARSWSVDVSSVGSFITREPVFESEPSSSDTGDDVGVFPEPQRVPVRVAWRGLTVVIPPFLDIDVVFVSSSAWFGRFESMGTTSPLI